MFASSKRIHNIQMNGHLICRIIQSPCQRSGTCMQGCEVPHDRHAMYNRSSVPRTSVGHICTTNWGDAQYNAEVENRLHKVGLRSTERTEIQLEQNAVSTSRPKSTGVRRPSKSTHLGTACHQCFYTRIRPSSLPIALFLEQTHRRVPYHWHACTIPSVLQNTNHL